jgi:DNA-binding PadR family transcriptional regulator
VVNDWVDFNTLKEMLKVTDGNLASHLSNLEKKLYVEVKKEFIGKKPSTSYRVTHSGRKVFTDHLDALEQIIKSTN